MIPTWSHPPGVIKSCGFGTFVRILVFKHFAAIQVTTRVAGWAAVFRGKRKKQRGNPGHSAHVAQTKMLSPCEPVFRLDDVNDVRWSPTGDAIASASDDSTIRLFDLRADAELGCYQRKPVMFSCNSIDFSVGDQFNDLSPTERVSV